MRNRMKKNCIVWMLLLPLLIGCGRKTGGAGGSAGTLMLTDSLQKVVSVETVHEMPLSNELLLNGRVGFNPEQLARLSHLRRKYHGGECREMGDYVKERRYSPLSIAAKWLITKGSARAGSRLYLPTAIWKLHGICSTGNGFRT